LNHSAYETASYGSLSKWQDISLDIPQVTYSILAWLFFLVSMIFLLDTKLKRGKKCNAPFGDLSLTLYELEKFFPNQQAERTKYCM